MTQINQTIRKELLKRAEDNKLYTMTNLTAISRACNVSSSDVTSEIQKMFLTCDSSFTFDLSQTRSGVKIVALELFKANVNSIEFLDVETNLAIFMLSQFAKKVKEEDIKKIVNFYEALLKCSDKIHFSDDVLFFSMTKKDDRIYKQINNGTATMHPSEIDYILDLILKHGYAFEKDGHIIWKLYSPKAIVSEKDLLEVFTVMVKKHIQNVEEVINTPKPVTIIEKEIVEEPLTVSKAFSFLAKEFGLIADENESKNKLEEMAAMTNELIMNFNELQDWEKLKSWDKFVKDWQSIMGEAVNDRN